VQLIFSDRHTLLKQISNADLVICAVLVHGAIAPHLIRREDLKTMHKGAVIVDISIDQGGCVETMHPTTHENPTFILDGIVHYGVANMPGGVPLTSTLALTNATLPYVLQLANKGYRRALKESPALLKGLNIIGGKITHRKVAEAFGLEYHVAESIID
jgi:alanine dehydrogenase